MIFIYALSLSSTDVFLYVRGFASFFSLDANRSRTAKALTTAGQSEKRWRRSKTDTASLVPAVCTLVCLTSGSSFAGSINDNSLFGSSFSHRKAGPVNQLELVRSFAHKPLDAWSVVHGWPQTHEIVLLHC